MFHLNQMKACLLMLCMMAFFISGLHAQNNLWNDTDPLRTPPQGERLITPQEARYLSLDLEQLEALLSLAPMEFTEAALRTQVELVLPMPDGRMQRFQIVESPIMARELASRYPQIKTYAGWGLDNPAASVRFDLTPKGFHAMVLSPEGTVYIDPLTNATRTIYQSYYTHDYAQNQEWRCHVDESFLGTSDYHPDENVPVRALIGDCQLRQYRIAIATSGEYSTFHGGTKALVLAEINTAMNRVNGIYERELSIRMNLIANNDDIIYLDAIADPYTNDDANALLGENQSNLDTEIGNANYDIGHVFTTGGGGLASLGVVCQSGSKARGETGLGSPVGDPYYVDYVSHEIGHQFGGNHTFNGDESNCGGGNRNNATAFEPGSGTTIMAYAGICGSQNVQSNSDDYFHRVSLIEISNYVVSGSGSGCPTTTALANNPPNITGTGGSSSYTIPHSTPFMLTGTATDADANTLTYCWEQYDNEISTQPPVSTATNGPNFRSVDPSTNPTRYFPNLPDLANGIAPTWEVLPTVARSMDFRLTVRDNAPGGGCVDEDAVSLTFANLGPFDVISFHGASAYKGGDMVSVNWTVNGTNAAPINCANVDILLSTDGGLTYPTVLLSGTANTGGATVSIPPGVNTEDARFMVRCSDNIFFDINENNFTVDNTPPSLACPSMFFVDLDSDCKYDLNDFTGTAIVSDNFDDNVSLTQSPLPGTLYNGPQTVTVTFTATDDAGNTSTCNFNVEVEDDTNPTILCNAGMGNITVNNDPGECGAIVSFPVTFDDNCPGASLLQTAGLASGAFFPVGTTNNTFKVTDGSGNMASCSFSVTVIDNEPPIAICRINTIYLTPDGTYTLLDTDVLDFALSSDNCGAFSVTDIAPAGFDCDNAGMTYPVSVEVTDIYNNVSNCTATISVEIGDALPPGWSANDIGNTGIGNDYAFDPCTSWPNPEDGEFTITGGGNNATSSNTDNIAFANQELCGDGEIIAKVESVTNNGYGGLVVRESILPGSRQVSLFSNLTNVLRHETRYTSNGPKQVNAFYKPVPIWLKIVRQGNWFFAYYSTTGNHFSYVHAVNVGMPSCIKVGLSAFTYWPNQQTEAVFSFVEVNAGAVPWITPPALEVAEMDKVAPALFPNPAQSVINITLGHFAGEEGGEPAELYLRDQLGRTLETRLVPSGTEIIEWATAQLEKGVYFIELRTAGGKAETLRFVKM
jgi:hypothetical protein